VRSEAAWIASLVRSEAALIASSVHFDAAMSSMRSGASWEVSLLLLHKRRLNIIEDFEHIDRMLLASVPGSTSHNVGFFCLFDGVVVPSEGLPPSDALSLSCRSLSLCAGNRIGIRLVDGDMSEGLSPSDVSSSLHRSLSLRTCKRAACAETVNVSGTPVLLLSGGRPVNNNSGFATDLPLSNLEFFIFHSVLSCSRRLPCERSKD
jgi:hypothetical protein